MRTNVCLAWWALLTLTALPLAAQSLKPTDFARGIRLNVTDDEPIHVAVLPEEVYETATRADLGDVRVFNGDGEEVPHAIHRGEPDSDQSTMTRSLPLFPVYGRAGVGTVDLGVQVTRTSSGTLVRVDQERSTQPVRAYLVDASELAQPIRQLTLHWPDTTSYFVTSVVAETSADLKTWTRWGDPVTVAHLRHGDHVLSRNELVLPPRDADYIRLSWSDRDAPPLPERVEATLTAHRETEREWARFEGREIEDGVYMFDQQGVLPADRIGFELPNLGALARAELESAGTPEGPWHSRYRGLVYRLRIDGYEIATPPISTSPEADRFWRLRVDPAGGGLGQGTPVIMLGWTPERLLFIPRGAPPYTLAFGAAGVEPAGFSSEELLRPLSRRQEDVLAARPANLGPVFELGGAERLSMHRAPWGRIVLWGVLVLGVALLLTMTVRLIRQVNGEREA